MANAVMSATPRPTWVSDTLYPFSSHFLQTARGRIHYIDEGEGRPLLFVHGNPSWSFEYRQVIETLREDYRCIALDHLGFGLSDRSDDKADYHPAAHAKNFAALMDALEITDATLVFADWGGPIALDFARHYPERISSLVILNSWCWPVNKERHFQQFSFFMSSWLGQWLIKRFNFFVTQVTPQAVGDRSILTPEVMDHYINAQSPAQARAASAALPGYIIGATDWLAEIWAARAAFSDKPALILWGLKDIAFRRKELDIWRESLSHCHLQELPEYGHFLAEEAPARVADEIRGHMQRVPLIG